MDSDIAKRAADMVRTAAGDALKERSKELALLLSGEVDLASLI
jgi:hypothetical protein